MMKLLQNMLCLAIAFSIVFAITEGRPQNSLGDNNQDLDNIESDVDDIRGAYYDLPAESLYSNVPMDRLQMLFAKYRPNAYLRSPTWNNMNELFRVPESKRQVRYRQCYFNPISCFKK
ncbi:uncharacterized protein LOC119690269 [Teleopsis dalmanni]|uniref:uncharacterized protein LOC119690269 n=1 Tax=Teleopsis dalmanni TaxID=139649 RepID=UPI0018CE1611|nr:uncharacterized protein LOC119690269 [Teleopsis dalmanni]